MHSLDVIFRWRLGTHQMTGSIYLRPCIVMCRKIRYNEDVFYAIFVLSRLEVIISNIDFFTRPPDDLYCNHHALAKSVVAYAVVRFGL